MRVEVTKPRIYRDFVQGDASEAVTSGSAANDSTKANIPTEHVKALSNNQQAQQQFANAALNSQPSTKGSGLLSKYKYMKGRRRSQGSDTGDEKADNSNGNQLEYSPLGKGENGEGRVDIEATSSPFTSQVRKPPTVISAFYHALP